MTTKDRILLESKAWRLEKINLDGYYFNRLNQMHSPRILWISSTDSLASIREMTNTEPGDIIVYRNLGSQVREDDLSLMAILEDAVEICRVSQIIVCGYSHCSGIRNVLLGMDDRPSVKGWLKHLGELYERHTAELRELPFEQREKRMSELNIQEQVQNLSKLPLIRKAWEKSESPEIYGWYFDLLTGSLQEVFSMDRNDQLKQISSITQRSRTRKITAS